MIGEIDRHSFGRAALCQCQEADAAIRTKTAGSRFFAVSFRATEALISLHASAGIAPCIFAMRSSGDT